MFLEKDLLLEVGADEIPARYLKGAIEEFSSRAREALQASRLKFTNLSTYGTPRRLVLYVQGLSPVSAGKSEKVRGPSKKAAYDEDGKPTRALLGFCRSLGINPEDVILESNNGGEYVYGIRNEPGRPVTEILPEILPQVVMGMDCPRPLRWGDENWRWYRPIRWVVCLYGDQVVPLEIAGIKAGRRSFGHRTLHPGPLEIRSSQGYFEAVERGGVMVDQDRRKELIWKEATEAARQISGFPLEDEDLLWEVTNLTEHPAPFLGRFDEAYLRLPREVLVTVMRHHQRYFPIVDERGNVLPGFIGIRDGHPESGIETVRAGNQWVIRARLEDASFFYAQDRKTRLEERIPELKGVFFLRGAGTLLDKTRRLESIAGSVAKSTGLTGYYVELSMKAARLSKADLVTLMVREFPELEGIMGGHYAGEEGLEKEVCDAISQQYLPRGMRSPLPDKGVSAVLALSDKLDTLAVAFGLGLEPTSSQDPLGLRRLAQGVVNIILSHRYDVDLLDLLSVPVNLAGEILGKEPGRLKERLFDFLKTRVEVTLLDGGQRLETVRAVLGGREKRIARLPDMAKSLEAVARTPALEDIVVGWRRTSVLAKSTSEREIREDLLVEEPEIRLYREASGKREEAQRLFEAEKYEEYLNLLESLRGPIDECLDKVLIMAEEPEVRENRLRLLGYVADLFTAYADFAHVLPLLGVEKGK